jgi:hypothetical protein
MACAPGGRDGGIFVIDHLRALSTQKLDEWLQQWGLGG